jgi:hypothetical protein
MKRLIGQLTELVIKLGGASKFKDLIAGLRIISEDPGKRMMDRAMTLICDNLLDEFVPEFATNMTEFFAYALRRGPEISATVLRVHQSMWIRGKERFGGTQEFASYMKPFKVFFKKLPFFKGEGTIEFVRELIGDVLIDGDGGADVITNVDVTGQGRVEGFGEPAPLFEEPAGRAGVLLGKLGVKVGQQ